jgi:hypothetical protein
MYSQISQITTDTFENVSGQPFILTIDYGNITTLDARPYAYVLQALFYMRDNRVNDYNGTKIMLIKQDLKRRQEMERQRQEMERQRQEYVNRWMESRMQLGTQGGGNKRRKSKKNVNINMTNKNKNKSRYRRRGQRRSQSIKTIKAKLIYKKRI